MLKRYRKRSLRALSGLQLIDELGIGLAMKLGERKLVVEQCTLCNLCFTLIEKNRIHLMNGGSI